jgi:hypothetical protein
MFLYYREVHHGWCIPADMKRTKPLDQRAVVPMDQDMMRGIDEWRRQQPDLPNRAEAIRRMIDASLATIVQTPAASPTGSRRRRARNDE